MGVSGELLDESQEVNNDTQVTRLPNCLREGTHCELSSCKGIEVIQDLFFLGMKFIFIGILSVNWFGALLCVLLSQYKL